MQSSTIWFGFYLTLILFYTSSSQHFTLNSKLHPGHLLRSCTDTLSHENPQQCLDAFCNSYNENRNWGKNQSMLVCNAKCDFYQKGRFSGWEWVWVTKLRCPSISETIWGKATKKSRSESRDWAIKDFYTKAKLNAAYFQRMGFIITPRGCHTVAHDVDEVKTTLTARGLSTIPILALSRPVNLNDALIGNAAFRVTRLESTPVPGTGISYCQHLNPELVWRPEWQMHPNGCTAMTQLHINVIDPPSAAQVFLLDMDIDKLVGTEANRYILHLKNFQIILTVRNIDSLGIYKLTFGIDSMDKLISALAKGNIEYHKENGRIVADTQSHIGCVLEFESIPYIIGCDGEGSQAHQLNNPSVLSFDVDRNMYVNDFGNHRTQKFLFEKDSCHQVTFPSPTEQILTISFKNQAKCQYPQIRLIPESTFLSPIQIRRNRDFYILSIIKLNCSKSVYIQVNPTGITVNLVPLGTSMITSGYQQDLYLNPGNYSNDPDGYPFNSTVYFIIPNSQSLNDSSDLSCLLNKTNFEYNGMQYPKESSIKIFRQSLQLDETYQFMIQMNNRQNSSIYAIGYVLIQIKDLNKSMIITGCVISTLSLPNVEYHLINPTTQVALENFDKAMKSEIPQTQISTIVSNKCCRLPKTLHFLSTKIPYEDVQCAANVFTVSNLK
ncbi:hypothetical protein I4U23_031565 [Adineta vaga]|nr:hypothetical protein I4U23_031565 [Adineta vaga]